MTVYYIICTHRERDDWTGCCPQLLRYALITQVCVPRKFRKKIMKSMCSDTHLGFQRLYSRIRCRFHWDRMYMKIHDFVVSCIDCQLCKPDNHPLKNPVDKLPIAQPLTRYNVDIHGPYRESNGYKYILAFICITSGWVELIPFATTNAEVVVQAIHDHIICRYALCLSLTLFSDCSTAFISKLTKLYCETFGIKRSFTSPYNPRAYSRIEALGGSILNPTAVERIPIRLVETCTECSIYFTGECIEQHCFGAIQGYYRT